MSSQQLSAACVDFGNQSGGIVPEGFDSGQVMAVVKIKTYDRCGRQNK